MEKEFVPYEQALELKELGFKQACLSYYSDCFHGGFQHKISKVYSQTEYSNQLCSVPLYQQAFRWFREKYGIFSSTWCFETEHKFFVEFGFGIQKFEVADKENTELACLKKLIEIAKNK